MKYNNNDKIKEIDNYFYDIKGSSPLSRKEERELAQKIQDGDEAALNKLVSANLKFVVSVAKKYKGTGVPFADLISEGNLGLIKAAGKYDGREDVKFTSYAVWWIRAAIQECINAYSPALSTVNVDEYVINNTTQDDDMGSCGDGSLISNNYEDDYILNQSREDTINELLSVLVDREVEVIKMYFGLGDGDEMTLTEIGDVMNLTNERVRVIKDKALVKLKSAALMSDDFSAIKALCS